MGDNCESELKPEKVFKSLYIRQSDSADTRVEHAFGSVQRSLSSLQAGTCVPVGEKGRKKISLLGSAGSEMI